MDDKTQKASAAIQWNPSGANHQTNNLLCQTAQKWRSQILSPLKKGFPFPLQCLPHRSSPLYNAWFHQSSPATCGIHDQSRKAARLSYAQYSLRHFQVTELKDRFLKTVRLHLSDFEELPACSYLFLNPAQVFRFQKHN